MRREVCGLGAARVTATAGVFALCGHLLGIAWLIAIALGGAVAMSSTAILLQQLTERAELNRTHGRLAFSMLLFQDLAFVPFLALGGALIPSRDQRAAQGEERHERQGPEQQHAECEPAGPAVELGAIGQLRSKEGRVGQECKI